MIKSEEVFKIGQFTKPHGIKGEITLVTDCDVFDDTDDPYIICDMDGILVPFSWKITGIRRSLLCC